MYLQEARKATMCLQLWKLYLCTVSCAPVCCISSSLQSHLILLEVLRALSAWEGPDAAGPLVRGDHGR